MLGLRLPLEGCGMDNKCEGRCSERAQHPLLQYTISAVSKHHSDTRYHLMSFRINASHSPPAHYRSQVPVAPIAFMDTILRSPEILSQIAIATYWANAQVSGRRLDLLSVLALALTCKAFLDPTLDQLWRRQLTIHNLLRTLPEDSWSEYDGHYVGPDGCGQLLIVSAPHSTVETVPPHGA